MTTANWSLAARKLTWQPGAGGRGGRWKKVFSGFTLYYAGGSGREDAEAHSEATYRCWIDLREISAGRQPPSKLAGGWDAYDEKLDRQTDLQSRLRVSTDNWTREPEASPAPVIGETIADVIESYLRLRQRHVRAGLFRPKSYARLKSQLSHVIGHSGGRPVTAINGQWIDEFRDHLLGAIESEDLARETAANVAGVTRSWLTWLYETERLESLPRNVRRLRIDRETKMPNVFTAEQLRQILSVGSDRNRLYLFLMANCGMYGSDIATLRPDEVDWDAGTITRKRTKTARHANAPTTTYQLWPETFELLKRFRSEHGERVVLSSAGTPLWSQRLTADGRVIEVDLISQAINRHFQRTDLQPIVAGRTAQTIRKSGASLIKASDEYADLDVVYLSHAPSGVAARHYSATPQERFDACLRWLHARIFSSTSLRARMRGVAVKAPRRAAHAIRRRPKTVAKRRIAVSR